MKLLSWDLGNAEGNVGRGDAEQYVGRGLFKRKEMRMDYANF
jgi:hypothetical protein